jgi:hypothetical protein
MSTDSPDLIMLQKIRDNKDVQRTIHPIDRLMLLKEFAERDYKPNTTNLIDTLLEIIDGLHNRICKLEEATTTANTG